MKKEIKSKEFIKQKISKNSWLILCVLFIIEILLLNAHLIFDLNVSIYSRSFIFWKVMVEILCVDLCFIIAMIDFAQYQKKPKKIYNLYKNDIETIMLNVFGVIEILKLVLTLCITKKYLSGYSSRYLPFFLIFGLMIIVFVAFNKILLKKDIFSLKLRKLKKQFRKGKVDFKFVLIDGNITPSTFDIERKIEHQSSKDLIYVNIEKELNVANVFTEEEKKIINQNAVAIIHEIKNKKSKENVKVFDLIKNINTYKMIHIIAAEDISKIELDEYIKTLSFVNICNVNSAIEFTENLFLISKEKKIDRFDLIKTNRKIRKLKSKIKLEKNDLTVDETKIDLTISKKLNESDNFINKDKYIDDLNNIYQNNYNNRLNYNVENLPKDGELMNLYKNAYLNTSPYESILKFFNYITAVCKIVEYYLYAKNNSRFNKDEIFTDIISDNPPVWTNHITLNVYKKKEDTLYANIRKNRFKLNDDEKILLKVYLSKMINSEIIGEDITFTGLTYLFKEFRNKVEAHGIINDGNVYAVWNLTFFFANMLNKMLKVSEIKIEKESKNKDKNISENTINISIGKDNKKVNLGKYILVFDNYLYFIKDTMYLKDRSFKRLYINYFTGDIKFEVDKNKETK